MNKVKKQFFGSNTVYTVLLVSIVLFGSLLRIHGADKHLSFTDDSGSYFSHLRSIVLGQSQEAIVGPAASVPSWVSRDSLNSNEIRHGKFMGLVLAFVLQITHFQPVGLVQIWIIVDICIIVAMYWAASGINRHAGLIAAFLYAIGHWPIYFSRVPFGFPLTSFFVAISIGSFVRIIQKKEEYWPLFVFVLALFPHIHNVGYIYDAFLVFSLLIWHISLPKATSIRGLTFFSLIPVAFLFFWDWNMHNTMLHWVTSGSVVWQRYLHLLWSTPQEVLLFLEIVLTGNPLTPLELSIVSVTAGILGLVVTGSIVNIQDDTPGVLLTKRLYRRFVAWLGLMLVLFVMLNRGFYEMSPGERYTLPSYLVAIVALYIGMGAITSWAIRQRKIIGWGACVVIFSIGLYSGSAVKQIIWDDTFHLLTFATKQELLHAIDADGKDATIVCIVNKGGEQWDNFQYIWHVGPYRRDVRFMQSCSGQAPTGNVWYGILTPGKDWKEYAGPNRILYKDTHASYTVIIYE